MGDCNLRNKMASVSKQPLKHAKVDAAAGASAATPGQVAKAVARVGSGVKRRATQKTAKRKVGRGSRIHLASADSSFGSGATSRNAAQRVGAPRMVRLAGPHDDPPHAAPGLLAKLAASGTLGSVRSSKECCISSSLLLHRVSAGESAAIEECIERFGGLVWSLARRTGLPEAELEDAVHEIFTELWHNGHKYDASIASEAAFVAVIARRRLIDRRRRISRRPTSAELTELNAGGVAATEGAGVQLAEEARVAVQALETLSTEQQRVLRLSVYEGLSHELIARATGMPLGTVKTHARRGLIRLREMLLGADGEATAEAQGSNGSQASGTGLGVSP